MDAKSENKLLTIGGSALMVAAAAFTLAVFVDHWTDLEIAFPRFWYTSRSLHPLICASLFLGGWYCLRSASSAQLPRHGQPVFEEVCVYTGEHCSLCDQAMAVLTEYARWLPPIVEIDIHDDPDLKEKFGQSIPVVEMDGVIQFRGRVNREVLERLIMSRQKQQASVTVRPTTGDDS